MKFFCAECQEKYNVGDIAVNIYDICKDEIKNNVKIALEVESGKADDKVVELADLIVSFLNEKKDAEKFFNINGNEAEHYLTDTEKKDGYIGGVLTLPLEWILERFKKSKTFEKEYFNEIDLCENPDNLSYEVKAKIIFKQYIKFFYGLIPGDGEMVLDHIADSNNVPFPYKDASGKTTMRGYIRRCSHCGKIIPRAVGRAPEVVVWLAGTARAAKTSSLISIASGLNSGKYSKYGLSMQPFSYDGQWDKIQDQIDKYNLGIKVDKTPQTIEEVPSQSILVNVGDSAGKIERRVLTFVDIPGEFFDNEGQGLSAEFFEMYSKMLRNLDFVWLHISKLAAYKINWKDKVIDERHEKMLSDSAEEVKILEACEAGNIGAILSEIGKNAGGELPPTAVVLTKSEIDLDDLKKVKDYQLFPTENEKISQNVNAKNKNEIKRILVPDTRGHYHLDEKAFFDTSKRVREFFCNTNERMMQAIESNCPYKCYMSVAAYGHPAADPDKGDIPYEPNPYHEMFPLIWTMAMSGAIQIFHGCSWSKTNIFGAFTSTEEGLVPVRFSSDQYLKNQKNKTDTKGKRKSDKTLCDEAVAANLLMERFAGNSSSYTKTKFMHGRE